VSRYQKGKTKLVFTEARDSDWQWHQLGHTQVCTSLQSDNHASTPPLGFLQAGCPSCRPTNSVKALKATTRRSFVTEKCKQKDGFYLALHRAESWSRADAAEQAPMMFLSVFHTLADGAVFGQFSLF